jgi:hypothetical protein
MRRSNVGDASFILHVGYLSPGRVEKIWAKLHSSLGFLVHVMFNVADERNGLFNGRRKECA